ncbi:MAG: glyoxalase [Acidocella sp.]|nr:glyoxalase [Acidocella sp.]
MTMRPPFHLAFAVHDLAAAREFYGTLLGCVEGRSDSEWVDFDFRGHQIVAHLDHGPRVTGSDHAVDGHAVPIPHFGLVLAWEVWHALADRLVDAGVAFVIPPCIRFAGEPGEQATMFLCDPSGNALEFKAFQDISNLFAK